MTSLFSQLHLPTSRSGGKDRLKALFEFENITINNIPSSQNGKSLSLSWKRGRHFGSLKDSTVSDGSVSFENFNFKSSLSFKEDKWDEKVLILTIKQGLKSIGKASIDLGKYHKNDTVFHIGISLAASSPCPSLNLNMKTKWLKVNDKVFTKIETPTKTNSSNSINIATPNGNTNGSAIHEELASHPIPVPIHVTPGPVLSSTPPPLEYDRDIYQLRTDDQVTETTTTGSLEEEDIENMADDPFTAASLFEAEAKKAQDEIETLRRKLQMVEGESHQRSKTIELQERETEKLRVNLEEVERKFKEKDEELRKANQLNQEIKAELEALKKAHDLEVQQSRIAKTEAETTLQTKVNSLNQELEAARTMLALEQASSSSILKASHPQPTPQPQPEQQNNNNEKIEQLEQEISGLCKTIAERDREITTLKAKLEEKTQEITKIQSQNTSLNSELDRRTVAHTILNTKFLQAQGEIERVKSMIGLRELEISDLKKKARSLEDKSTVLRTRTSDHDNLSSFPRLVTPVLFSNPFFDKYWVDLFLLGIFVFFLLNHLL
eukprot:TRINITY_DN16875_c0_g1_i1.p1 TRINITY_DN16875_c0_g1~~TRINITY_DN16875_c0_g1_i1.p1  ORF type:complete len:551 (-),score=128.47 TRINITY_DN16875_c0_g1_i1:291-1943(-)